MKTYLMPALIVGGATLALLAFASAGLADPSDMYTATVPKHRHFLVKPTGEVVPIGPQICENENLQAAFEQFHYNVHHSVVPRVGAIPTLGPQNGAPGLNNDQGGEIVGVPGCG